MGPLAYFCFWLQELMLFPTEPESRINLLAAAVLL